MLAFACAPPSAAVRRGVGAEIAAVDLARTRAELPFTMRMLDVGQGDAILISFGGRAQTPLGSCGVEWLLDAGPSGNRVERVIEAVDCDLDAFVLTHPHADHFDGAARLLEHRVQGRPFVREVLTNGERRGPDRDATEPSSWPAFREGCDGAAREIVGIEEGSVLTPVPDVNVHVLWSGSAEGGHFADTRDG